MHLHAHTHTHTVGVSYPHRRGNKGIFSYITSRSLLLAASWTKKEKKSLKSLVSPYEGRRAWLGRDCSDITEGLSVSIPSESTSLPHSRLGLWVLCCAVCCKADMARD